MAEVKFPTEVVDLPSKGLLYPESSPLSTGKIEIKYMTAREEDILTSANLIKKGIVVDKLIEALIIDKSIKVEDLLLGDKNAILIASRVLAYGKDYEVEVNGQNVTVDLTTLSDRKLDKSLVINGANEFEFELPNSKNIIHFKILTHADEVEIQKELKGYEKLEKITGVSSGLTTRLKHQIVSVDNDSDQKVIDNFIDNNFLALDHRAYRDYYDEVSPDIELKFDYTSQAGNLHRLDVPLGSEFFWPAARK